MPIDKDKGPYIILFLCGSVDDTGPGLLFNAKPAILGKFQTYEKAWNALISLTTSLKDTPKPSLDIDPEEGSIIEFGLRYKWYIMNLQEVTEYNTA